MNNRLSASARPTHTVSSTEVAPPAVFWRATASQFISYIGYQIARKGKRKGERVRKAHYLGRNLRQATLDAILIDQRWDKVKAEHKAKLERLAAVLGPDYRSLPVWPTDESLAERAAFEAIERPFEEPDAEDLMPVVRKTTLRSLQERYLKAQEQRIGLLGKRGLKRSTYRVIAHQTGRSMAPTNQEAFIQDMKREDFRRLVDWWLTPGLTGRSFSS